MTRIGAPLAADRVRTRRRGLVEVVLALAVGAVAGLAALAVDIVIRALRQVAGRGTGALVGGVDPLAAVLVVVGAVVAALVLEQTRTVPDERGVPLVMEAESADTKRLPERSAWWRAVAAALAIGTGSSAGREGPSVLLGAAVAERTGRRLGLDAAAGRRLVAAGAAAGIGASIHLPVVAALFVVEVLLADRDLRSLLAVALGATSGWAVWSLLGGEPPLAVHGVVPADAGGVLAAAAPVGVAATAAAVALTYGIVGTDRLRARTRLGIVPRIALGAVVVAGLGLLLGAAAGSGELVTASLLEGRRATALALLGLVVAKVVATSATLGSGLPGGAFTPAVVVGAASGAFVAQLATAASPAHVRALAVVGAAAALAALARAPLAAVALSVEVAGGVELLPAAVVAVVVALVLVEVTGAARLYDASTT